MALPTKTSGQGLGGLIGTSESLPIGRAIQRMEVDVVHELGSSEVGLPVTEYRVIPPSQFPTVVTFRSQVVGHVTSQPTDEYVATVRRRKARHLADSLAELATYCDRSDFTVWTFPIIEKIKEMITTLADSGKEGNTREILRQLRDTFMNGGWETYRRSEARTLAFAIVDHLASAVEIIPKDANEAFDKLIRLGLNPVGQFICSSEMDGGATDDEKD